MSTRLQQYQVYSTKMETDEHKENGAMKYRYQQVELSGPPRYFEVGTDLTKAE